ncbi:MFS transporter [Aestuariispira insulae]|uniref:MFS transporter n=1 Tax=Aestuariispira insulae TaxID=1461337 RepID=A0A3D9H8N1_9PROT|nr:MFS transporter [Aestuariispira insulae]RED45829.1 MFS transporter [Aestuariispira insulae]
MSVPEKIDPWRVAAGLSGAAKVLLFGTFCARLFSFMIWPFFAVMMTRKFSTPVTEIGWQFSIAAVIAIFAAPVSGMLADRFGRVVIMVIAGFVAIISYLAMYFIGTEQALLTCILLSALASGSLEPLLRSLLGDCASRDEERPVLFHIRYYIINFSVAAGPLAGMWFADHGLDGVFLLGALGNAILLVSMMVASAHSRGGCDNGVSGNPGMKAATVAFLQNRFFLTLFLSNFFLVFLYAHTDEPLTFYLITQGIEGITGVIASINLTNTLVVLAAHLFLLKWLLMLDEHRAYCLAFFFLAAGLALISVNSANLVWVWLVAIGLATLAEIIAMPLLATLIDREAPKKYRSSYAGLYIMSNLGGAAVPFLGALVIEKAGGDILFAAVACACLPVGFIGYRLLGKSRSLRKKYAEEAA